MHPSVHECNVAASGSNMAYLNISLGKKMDSPLLSQRGAVHIVPSRMMIDVAGAEVRYVTHSVTPVQCPLLIDADGII